MFKYVRDKSKMTCDERSNLVRGGVDHYEKVKISSENTPEEKETIYKIVDILNFHDTNCSYVFAENGKYYVVFERTKRLLNKLKREDYIIMRNSILLLADNNIAATVAVICKDNEKVFSLSSLQKLIEAK